MKKRRANERGQDGVMVQVSNDIHKRDADHDKLHQMNLNELTRG